jgi:hypothetical protein
MSTQNALEKKEKWPSEKYYTPSKKVIYLGTLIKIDEGKYGDTFRKGNKIIY